MKPPEARPRRRLLLRRMLATGLLIGLLAYAALCAALLVFQEQLVFHPKPGSGRTPEALGLPFESLWLDTADGVKLHGWYLPADPARRHVLFLHGNAGNLSNRLRTLRTLHALGHPVLIVDYRGFGLSGGEPSETGVILDAETAWRHLIEERHIAPQNIVIYGRSLGGAVAAQLAARVSPHGLILESTFSSLRDMAHHRYPWVPVDYLLRMDFDSRAALAGFDRPVLVAHSPTDRTVPYALGRRLAESLAGPVTFVELRGSHNRAFRLGGAEYHGLLGRFIGAAD